MLLGTNRCNSCQPCDNVGCLKFISSDCIITPGPYSCLGLGTGNTLTVVLTAINNAICTASGNIIIINNNITNLTTEVNNLITEVTEIINNPVPCRTWIDLPFRTAGIGQWQWENYGVNGYEDAKYSNVQGCTVKLLGIVKAVGVTIESGTSLSGSSIAQLPVGFYPGSNKSFSVYLNIVNISDEVYLPAELIIDNGGNIIVLYTNNSTITGTVDVRVSLDGISFETDI